MIVYNLCTKLSHLAINARFSLLHCYIAIIVFYVLKEEDVHRAVSTEHA